MCRVAGAGGGQEGDACVVAWGGAALPGQAGEDCFSAWHQLGGWIRHQGQTVASWAKRSHAVGFQGLAQALRRHRTAEGPPSEGSADRLRAQGVHRRVQLEAAQDK